MNWLLILTVGIVAANIVLGFFRGFLRVVYSMLAWIAILVVVAYASPQVADWLTKNTDIDERIESSCKKKLQNIMTGEEDEQRETEEKTESGNAGELNTVLGDWGMNISGLADGFLEESGVYDTMAQEMTVPIVKMISFILVFVTALIVSFLLVKILDLIGKLPVIGEANHALGAVAGFLKGIFLVWLIFSFIEMGSVTQVGAVLCKQIQSSALLLWIYSNNPIYLILKRVLGLK